VGFTLAFVFGCALTIWGFFDVAVNIVGLLFWLFLIADLFIKERV
jgi:hypothetical protein